MPRVGNQNVDSDRAFDSITHKSIWDALKSCHIDHDYISLLKKIYRDQKVQTLTKRATFLIFVKEQSKVTRCPSCCSTRFFNTH